jgi:broad specificity phosphatase PhoE
MTRYLRVTLSILLLLGAARAAAADQVIFFVRHAEKAPSPPPAPAQPSHSMLGDDPPLSPAGEQRAAKLAATLAHSGITAIYTTEFKRTRQTAAPLAAALKLTPVMSAAKDPAPLVAALKKAQGAVLVVGHSNTVPDLMRQLGVSEPVTIGDDDYDNLFVVVRNAAGKATLIRLKY